MLYFLLGLLAFVGLYFLANAFVNANPALIADRVRRGVGMALLVSAVLLALTGRWFLALPLAAFALSFLGPRHAARGRSAGGASGRSRVRSAMLEMELDHHSGAMRGRVIAGRFAERALDALSNEDLMELWYNLRITQQ